MLIKRNRVGILRMEYRKTPVSVTQAVFMIDPPTGSYIGIHRPGRLAARGKANARSVSLLGPKELRDQERIYIP